MGHPDAAAGRQGHSRGTRRAGKSGKSDSKKRKTGCASRTHAVNFLEILLKKYELLSNTIHLPQIDRDLYDELFIRRLQNFVSNAANRRMPQKTVRRDGRIGPLIGGLELVLDSMRQHRDGVMDVMRMVEHREDVIQRLIACCKFYDDGQCTIDDAQLSFLLLLQEHQMATVLVMDAIKHWQEGISTPEPFTLWQGQAYTDRILEDCEGLSKCSIGRSLSLHMKLYPCNSNMDLQRTAHRKDLMRRSKMISTRAVMDRGLDPVFCPEVQEHLEHQEQAAAGGGAEEHRHYGAPSQWKRQNRRGACKGDEGEPGDAKKKQQRLADAEGFILSGGETLSKSLEAQVKLAEEMELFMPFLRIPQLFIETSVAKGCVPLDAEMWPEMLNKTFCGKYAQDGETPEELPGVEGDEEWIEPNPEAEAAGECDPQAMTAAESSSRRSSNASSSSPPKTAAASSSSSSRRSSSSFSRHSNKKEMEDSGHSSHPEKKSQSPASSRRSASSKSKSSRSSSRRSADEKSKSPVSSRHSEKKSQSPASSHSSSKSSRRSASSKSKSSRSSSRRSADEKSKSPVSSRHSEKKSQSPASSHSSSKSSRRSASSKSKSSRSSSRRSADEKSKSPVSSRHSEKKSQSPASSHSSSKESHKSPEKSGYDSDFSDFED
eukprot:gene1548-933_t